MNLREAAKQALEALEDHATQYPHMQKGYTVDAITSLRAALAEEKNENTVQSTGGVHSRVSDGADRNVEAVTDCHDLEQARAVAISNLLAHFGITSANSDVNAVYLHKLLGDFLLAAIGCKKEGDKLSPPLEAEECGYPNCLSTNGCEKQCPAFPRIPDADTSKTSAHFADAGKMVATSQEFRQIEPVETIRPEVTVEPVAWTVYTLDGKSAFITDNPEDFTPEHKSLPLYTAPPKREPLTAPQIHELDWPDDVAFEEILEFTRAIERAHGIGGEMGASEDLYLAGAIMTPREIALSICEPWFNGDPCEGCECHKVCKKLVERIETAIQAERVPEIDFGNITQTVDSKESDHVADTGKTSDQSEDARGMVATIRDSRQVDPVATINKMETVEPVAYCTLEQLTYLKLTVPSEDKIAIYTAPPKREPLTDEEISKIFIYCGRDKETFARAIERAHGIGGEE